MIENPTPADPSSETAAALVAGLGRDSERQFRVLQMHPLDAAGFVLELLSALRRDNVDSLIALMRSEADDTALRDVLQLLMGCDPTAVRKLIDAALVHVRVSRDATHPNAWFPLRVRDDILETSTLREILRAFAAVNVTS